MADSKTKPVACCLAFATEFLGSALLVIVGCGSVMGAPQFQSIHDLTIALVFGLTATTLMYACSHLCPAHFNCAVTWAFILAGECGIAEGIVTFTAQLLGSTVGATVLYLFYEPSISSSGHLGSNEVNEGWAWYNVLWAETCGTFLVASVFLQTACNPTSTAGRAMSAVAVGFAIFVSHMLLVPIDGCSINPTRSFGTALVAQIVGSYDEDRSFLPFEHMWIFILAPLIGATCAAWMYTYQVKALKPSDSVSAFLSELQATALLVMFGCGVGMEVENTSRVLVVALAFGFMVVALSYTFRHSSGCHMNGAVTLGLVLTGHCEVTQGVIHIAAQMIGSLIGGLGLCLIFPSEKDVTQHLGANLLAPGKKWYTAFFGELICCFFLVYAVLQTTCHARSEETRAQAPLAVGLAAFVVHVMLVPVDGCSVNPMRSFGPALVATCRYGISAPWGDMWIFWLAPITAAWLAATMFKMEFLICGQNESASELMLATRENPTPATMAVATQSRTQRQAFANPYQPV